VVIACGADIIARHARSYEREDFVFDPLHYLALLEQKTGALDQAAPLVGWLQKRIAPSTARHRVTRRVDCSAAAFALR
jgi:hypothetical protein